MNTIAQDHPMQGIIKAFISTFQTTALNTIGSSIFEAGIKAGAEVKDNTLWLYITDKERAQHVVNIPIPFSDKGVTLLENNDVRRALCHHFMEETQTALDYYNVISSILFDTGSAFVPEGLHKRVSFVYQLATGVKWGTVAITVKNIQRCVNDLINRYPLHETYMNSFVMNNRLIIVDPEFDALNDPNAQHAYQLHKADKYFSRGWSTMGLSDGVLSSKNYILTLNLRKLSPFAIGHHNPQRNLYSTLGMRGDETPLIQSESMHKLASYGIQRGGWNLFTVFADIPDNWEDQLMVHSDLAELGVTYERRIQIFGTIMVKAGDELVPGQRIAVAPDGEHVCFDEVADRSVVHEITQIEVNVGGVKVPAYSMMMHLTRKLKDGVKLTNHAANKGVIRMKDLGYAIDPRTGEKRRIDIIVSSRAVGKRKNNSQVIEALFNNLFNNNPIVVKDDIIVDINELENKLEQQGFGKGGTWKCHTYVGEMDCVAGTVFWGVTHAVEDMLWDKNDTVVVNGRGLRTAGLKFSVVELRALQTRFGMDNPVSDEVMSYAQGADDISEKLHVLKAKRGELPKERYVLPLTKTVPVDVSKSTIVPASSIVGTVVDELFFPEGFILHLPKSFEVLIEDGTAIYQGHPTAMVDDKQPSTNIIDTDNGQVIRSNCIYIPSAALRKCWRHATGKVGLSDIGTLVNNIVSLSYRYIAAPTDINLKLYFQALFNYFDKVAKSLSTKSGDLSVYGMAIRYPFSAKAVATLSNSLPKNTVEIHQTMADNLEVKDGDVVLVERFPCLGFMSIRPQKVKVTNDPMCRYTIRVSGNSLGSLSLDFDGDVIYLASFHTPEAKEALLKEWTNPNETCYANILKLNKKMGKPFTRAMSLQEYNLNAFDPLTIETHHDVVDKATGVKSFTGPVVALAYNVMRIVENSYAATDQKINCGVEIWLDKVANSVFKQKHGATPLKDIVIDAICTGDISTLVAHEFDRSTSTIICNIIRQQATAIGVTDLVEHHRRSKENGTSNIINKVVRTFNKVYFASRASLEPCSLLTHIEAPALDIPSKLLQWIMSGKSELTKNLLTSRKEDVKFKGIRDEAVRGACKELCEVVDDMFAGAQKNMPGEVSDGELEELVSSMRRIFTKRRTNVTRI